MATSRVTGAERLKRRIQTIRQNLDLPAMTEEINALLLVRIRRRFDNEVDPENRPWVPLAPVTIADKIRRGFGDKKKLVRTGKLRDAIQSIRGGAGAVYTNTGASARIGIDDPSVVARARALNSGTNKIPARRFLGIGSLDVKAVDSLLRRRAQKLEALK